MRGFKPPLALVFVIADLAFGQNGTQTLLRRAQDDLDAGHYAASVKNGEAAATQFLQSGDRSSQAHALTTAGLAHLYSGEYAAALQNFNTALDISRQIHDVEGEINRVSNIGTVFYFQGRYADAMDRYQEALRIVEANSNEKWTASRRQFAIANIAILSQTLGQYERALDLYSILLNSQAALPPREQAQLLSNVGALRRRLGDPQKALETYRAAQALYKKAAHRDGEIAVLNNIGIVQAMDLHDYTNAAASFSEAFRLAGESGDRPLAVHARLYRGEALYRAGRAADSNADFEAALNEATELHEPEESWKALYGLARVADATRDASRCTQLLTRAVELIESVRAGLGGSSLRSDFLADKRDVYDLLIEHTSDTAEVFRLMEQSRARTLQDRVSKRPELASFAQTVAADSIVLEYWMGASSSAVLWISKSGVGMRRWKVAQADRDAINALPALLSDVASAQWRGTAQTISTQLLSQIPPLHNSAIHKIIAIPDGPLSRLPFEALPFDERLLVERFTVSYSPSAALINTATASGRIRWPWQESIEAFADPAPGAGAQNMQLASMAGMEHLPGAAREVSGIANLLGGRAALHIGESARKQYLDAHAQTAPVLHFATHAYADSQDSNRSYILLAAATPTQRFDYLFLKEVYGLPLNRVELATLSACKTDAGKLVPGEGVESFSRAFLAAGARSVVTSLWSVGDKSTAEFMLRFYERLARGASKADALRAAKLDFLRYPQSSHPAYWAAFVLNGDPASRIPYFLSWWWFAAPLLFLPAAIVIVRTRAKRVRR